MDQTLSSNYEVSLKNSRLESWQAQPVALQQGHLLLCREGVVSMQINFEHWLLTKDSVVILFPGDVVQVTSGQSFLVEMLSYDQALLREACLQMEHTVYSLLRKDRCRNDKPVVSSIVKNMFALLEDFYNQPDCTCLPTLTLLQLKTFFLGFNDFLMRNPQRSPKEQGSERVNQLFSDFMQTLADKYKEEREVAFYAADLHISSKYLGQICRQKTGLNVKPIIDHYVILQLELQLRSSSISVKELAWQYHFSDVSFFCRYFKAHTGLTPLEYRSNR